MRSLGIKAGLVLVFAGTRLALAQSLAVPIAEVDDPLLDDLSIPAAATTQGMWSPVMDWPLVAVHVALLPDGDIISYGTPTGVAEQEGRVFDLWSPLAERHRTLPNAQNVNSFCSAGILQPSGKLLVSGGNGPRESTLFDYVAAEAAPEPSRLASERWYASMIMLSDGRTLTVGGGLPYVTEAFRNPEDNLTKVSQTPEVYTPGIGWRSLMGASSRDAFGPDFNRWWYPRTWAAPNGQVFGISTEKLWYLDTNGSGHIRTVGSFKTAVDDATRPNVGPTSTAVMYDVGRILQALPLDRDPHAERDRAGGGRRRAGPGDQLQRRGLLPAVPVPDRRRARDARRSPANGQHQRHSSRLRRDLSDRDGRRADPPQRRADRPELGHPQLQHGPALRPGPLLPVGHVAHHHGSGQRRHGAARLLPGARDRFGRSSVARADHRLEQRDASGQPVTECGEDARGSAHGGTASRLSAESD
jgi:hypothetical protein